MRALRLNPDSAGEHTMSGIALVRRGSSKGSPIFHAALNGPRVAQALRRLIGQTEAQQHETKLIGPRNLECSYQPLVPVIHRQKFLPFGNYSAQFSSLENTPDGSASWLRSYLRPSRCLFVNRFECGRYSAVKGQLHVKPSAAFLLHRRWLRETCGARWVPSLLSDQVIVPPSARLCDLCERTRIVSRFLRSL